MEYYYFGLMALLTALPMALHAFRATMTLGPFFGLAGVYSIILWQMLQTGWWVSVGSVDFNAGFTLIIPPILVGGLLTFAFDGRRTSRSYMLMVATACLAAWSFSAFRELLSRFVPLPYLVVLSNKEHLAVIGGLLLAQPVAVMAYIVLGRRAFLSLPVSLMVGILCWLMFYSMTNYGIQMGLANLRNEFLPFLLSALPATTALAVYGWVAAKMGLVMPERSLRSLFVWRTNEAAGPGKDDAMTNQDHVISELRLLNRKLATSARLMEYHMEHATYGIVIIGTDGKILRTNKTAEKMLLATNPSGHYLPALLGEALGCEATLAQIVAGSEGKRWGGRGANGENRWYEIIVTPLKESDTRAITTGYYILVKDVTTAVYAEARNLALRRIRDLSQAGQVLGHDFSNLLIGAEAQLRKIRARVHDQDSIEAIGTLSSVLNNARDMLKQLGSGSQFGSPSLRTEKIGDLVDEAVSICRGTAEENQVTVSVEGQRTLGIEADRSQMVRVFTNLLKNAIRASYPGGVVTVTIDRRGSGVQTVIADRGRGMSSEEINMAFDPGFSTKGEGKGGLGLAISYLMVEAHGGSLDLKKNPAGQGICAVVWLAESRAVEDYSDLSGQNVIVASTEPETIQALIAELEKNLGCYVAEAHNEEEIIALLEETQDWDAMIVDKRLHLERILQDGGTRQSADWPSALQERQSVRDQPRLSAGAKDPQIQHGKMRIYVLDSEVHVRG